MFANPEVSSFIDRLIGGQTPRGGAPPPTPGYRGALARALLGDITRPSSAAIAPAPAIQASRRPIAAPAASEGVNRGIGSQEQQGAPPRASSIGTGSSGITAGLENLGRGVESGLDQLSAARQNAGKVAVLRQGNAFPEYDSEVSSAGGQVTSDSGSNLPSFARQLGISAGTPSTGAVGAGVGGSRSWRNNNPGNIEYGGFAAAHGAVGSDGRFAIFPSEQAGIDAQRALLFNSSGYSHLTLPQAIAKWAPGTENNVPAYVAAMGGDTSGRKMGDYSPAEQDALLNSMRVHEGWRPGTATMPAAANSGPPSPTPADIAQDRQQDAADTSPPPSPSGLGGPQNTGIYNGQPYTYQIQPALGPQGMLMPPQAMPQVDPLALALAGGQMPPIDPNFGGFGSGLFG